MTTDPMPVSGRRAESAERNVARYREARQEILSCTGDHRELPAGFRLPRLTGPFNWAVDWFDAVARDNDQIALWIVEEDGSECRITFAEMAERSDRVATWLRELGVSRGDRVMIMLGNQPELWESMLAVAKLGAVIMPATAALNTADLADRLSRGGVGYLIVNDRDTAKFDRVETGCRRIAVGSPVGGWYRYGQAAEVESAGRFPGDTDADDAMLIYFTSGTASKPKLVEHSQVSYPVGHLTTMAWLGVQPGDTHLTISSPGWAKHAWGCFFAPWIAGAGVFVYNYRRFDAGALLDQIRRARVNTFCAPPTVWRMLIQADLGSRPEHLREVLGAGEPLNPDVIATVEKAWGLTVRDGYGQTETTLLVGNLPGQPVTPGAMGRPLPGVPVVLADPVTGAPAAQGEICLDLSGGDPVNLMTRYLGDPQRNEAVRAGGRYHTGDVAHRHADGTLTYVGRTDDVFKSSDYKVSPFELESVLIEHPAVVEAAVVPQPDVTRQNVPKAYVSPASGWAADEETARSIMAYVRDRVAAYLKVRRVEFTELPKTVSGKIRRVELRQREEDAFRAGSPIVTEYRYEDLLG